MTQPLRRYFVVGTLNALFLASLNIHAAIEPLNAFTEGERLIYTRVVEAYHKNLLPETIRERDLLAKNYPKSVHLDNAYYLTGVLEFQKQNMAEAVRDFATVIDRYPQSNKRPAALFAKAATYDKLNLKPQATRLWNQIVQEYPGSQESQRAWMQLKVASLNSSKKR